ncbi:hypothetical protein ROT00_12905 [Agromyces mediolanus]|uniref:hypothetical protein n=1 Tax=Agromyces mediolanus TaxID=41986 RepID=UPI003833B0B6
MPGPDAAPGAAALRHRDQTAFAAAAVCAVAAALIWWLWVAPIVQSVAAADSRPLGEAVTVELAAGEHAGVWARGIAANLGTVECRATGPGGGALAMRTGPSLDWDDTLWWMTPKPGFVQVLRFTADDAGSYAVSCRDSLETYDAEVLVAGDAFGSGVLGLGAGGASRFPIGSVLAFGAVVLPAVAVLIPVVILLRRAGTRVRERRRRTASEAAFRTRC